MAADWARKVDFIATMFDFSPLAVTSPLSGWARHGYAGVLLVWMPMVAPRNIKPNMSPTRK
jgi:hypothetical protein